jgi:predicted TIM-barrel fold metal-dependent hydrolase
VQRISKSSHLKGVIMSTNGRGQWLDDEALLPLYQTLSEEGMLAFIHPHFGVGNADFGDAYGHTLFLALGFTFETTTAVSRLVCSGLLDKVPGVQFLLAHSGGTLPFLAGRLDSCVAHDETIASKLAHKPSEYLTRNFYYDSLVYAAPALEASMDFVGTDRLMFGTDCPFFPAPGVGRQPMSEGSPLTPLDTTPWMSTTKNQDLLTRHVQSTRGHQTAAAIAGGNAARVLGLDIPIRA